MKRVLKYHQLYWLKHLVALSTLHCPTPATQSTYLVLLWLSCLLLVWENIVTTMISKREHSQYKRFFVFYLFLSPSQHLCLPLSNTHTSEITECVLLRWASFTYYYIPNTSPRQILPGFQSSFPYIIEPFHYLNYVLRFV